MAFWTSEMLRDAGDKVVQPFVRENVVTCAIELTMGREAFVTGGRPAEKLILDSEDSQVVIPPGQFALLLSHERVTIPLDAIGFISVRSKLKLLGLVNVSGFHVDPGFSGKLIFAVYNAGGNPVPISSRDRVFLLWLASLEKPTADAYHGSHANQESISRDAIMAIGQVAFSPSTLDRRLGKVEEGLNTIKTIAIGVVVALFVWWLTSLVGPQASRTTSPSNATVSGSTLAPITPSPSTSALPPL